MRTLPLVFTIIMMLVYWAGMAAIIWIDGQRQREKAQASGGVDFMDRSPWPYMLLGVLCGPLPLIVYFGTTRRSAAGWLLGVGVGLGWTVLINVVSKIGEGILVRSP